MRKLLLLRPEPGLSASVERARALGLEAIACPLFRIEPVHWDAPDPTTYDALLLTSANAVRSAGAALATWGLSRWDSGARFFGVAPKQPLKVVAPPAAPAPKPQPAIQSLGAADASRISTLETRLANLENTARAAVGSAGRADAMLVAFAARRAIDRGVALGYLEPLLVQRFGSQHEAAVATVITASREPVKLESLVAEYEALAPALRGGSPDENWWDAFRRELGTIISVHRADTPSPQPQARYDRALAKLEGGEVDAALAETMRLPGAGNAGPWIVRARRYIAAHRALDEIESGALLGAGALPIPTTQSP